MEPEPTIDELVALLDERFHLSSLYSRLLALEVAAIRSEKQQAQTTAALKEMEIQVSKLSTIFSTSPFATAVTVSSIFPAPAPSTPSTATTLPSSKLPSTPSTTTVVPTATRTSQSAPTPPPLHHTNTTPKTTPIFSAPTTSPHQLPTTASAAVTMGSNLHLFPTYFPLSPPYSNPQIQNHPQTLDSSSSPSSATIPFSSAAVTASSTTVPTTTDTASFQPVILCSPLNQKCATVINTPRANAKVMEEFLTKATADKNLIRLLMSMGKALRTISFKVRTASCGGTACVNSFGDEQLAVDMLANDLLFQALTYSHVCKYACSEEVPEFTDMGGPVEGGFSMTFDPLDGSSIVDTNLTVGTIIGVWPGDKLTGVTGRDQVAAPMRNFGLKPELPDYHSQIDTGGYILIRTYQSKVFDRGRINAADEHGILPYYKRP